MIGFFYILHFYIALQGTRATIASQIDVDNEQITAITNNGAQCSNVTTRAIIDKCELISIK